MPYSSSLKCDSPRFFLSADRVDAYSIFSRTLAKSGT